MPAGYSRFCAFLLLAAYLFSATPVGIGSAALLAKFDASHQVLLAESDGRISVVLHHRPDSAGHVHHNIASLLTIFAASNTTDQDHVISSSMEAPSEVLQHVRFQLPPAENNSLPVILPARNVNAPIRHASMIRRDAGLGIRSTVLLL